MKFSNSYLCSTRKKLAYVFVFAGGGGVEGVIPTDIDVATRELC